MVGCVVVLGGQSAIGLKRANGQQQQKEAQVA